MRRQAVVAAIAIGDGHGDSLPGLGAQGALALCAKGGPDALQDDWGIGDGLEPIGSDVKDLVDLGQQGLARGGNGLDLGVYAGRCDLRGAWG